jgi:Na+/H+ antiporter NhaD/arsenite permease-like protein
MSDNTMNFFSSIPLIVLAAVFFLIAVRQVGRFRFQIWSTMLIGAVIVILHGDVPASKIGSAINVDVMLFLFGMFVVGQALDQSGYLYHLSHRLFTRAQTLNHLILLILFVIGGLAALLMNDTLAIICTPLMLFLARQNNIDPKLLLITLAFAVTTGSVASPIGSPHNLLIAVNTPVHQPFLTFLAYLGVPTIINILITYLVLKYYFRSQFNGNVIRNNHQKISDPPLANLTQISIWVIVGMIILKILAPVLHSSLDFSLTFIAITASLPILIFSPKRYEVLKRIDWKTLVFFASMFVLMDSVWRTGFFQQVLTSVSFDPKSIPMILTASTLISQLVSNVPFVALYLPMIANGHHAPIAAMALSAGSTIAGNLFILGAASNVIIIQNAENHGETITFWEFARIGLPLTILQLFIYWLWLTILQILFI